MNVYIKTYGCQMNERDSESARAMLAERGHTIVSREEDADCVILNTCSVRDQAERKAIGKLGILLRLKRERPWMLFGIMGCMAQSRGEELLEKVPHLDFVIGTDNIHLLGETLEELGKGMHKLRHDARMGADTPGIDAHRLEDEEGRAQYNAFVSISRGCNRYCSYCIVPYVRGPERSRKMESIVEECRTLAAKGVKEIMLLGQNVASYGLDGQRPPLPDNISPFAELLEKINAIDGLRRIRFTSPHPAYFNKRLIEAVASLEKVCKSVHLPLQSGSDPVLKRMNRPYTAEQYFHIVSELRRLCPGITFSTDIIVGFPGESEEDFEQTRLMMEKVHYDNAYIFKYSPRKGTVSSRMEDDVPQEEKERRNQVLLGELEKINTHNNTALIGQEFELLAEGPSKRNSARWSGRTDTFKQVIFEALPGMKEGDFIRVRITDATPMCLYGEVIAEEKE